MEINVVTILDRAIAESENKLTSSTSPLLTALRNFRDVIRLRAQNETTKEDTDLNVKLQAANGRKIRQKEKFNKLLKDIRAEIKFKDEIIAQNCALIILQQQSHHVVLTKEKKIAANKMTSKQNELQQKKREVYGTKLSNLNVELENARMKNMTIEDTQRNCWNEKKKNLDDVLLLYDTNMFTQQEQIEMIEKTLNREKNELHNYKEACVGQEKRYNELMEEKEEYLEQRRQQKLYEIRVKIAKRTIVKFVEEHYPTWKKKKQKASKKRGKYKYKTVKKI